MLFGIETDTYDRDGTAMGAPHPDPRPSQDALDAAVAKLVGELDQSPPPFSAKKFAGKKFYELARKGEAVPNLPKKVKVARFDARVEGAEAGFAVACSSGTYIRSLVHDVGKDLGFGAHLIALRRSAVGAFDIKDAVTLGDLEARSPEARLTAPSWIPLGEIPLPFPAVALAPPEASKVKRGHAVPVRAPEGAAGAPWIRLTSSGDLLALAHLEPLGRGALALARPKIVLCD
jgi:tRNA pseudouridine55 synthase